MMVSARTAVGACGRGGVGWGASVLGACADAARGNLEERVWVKCAARLGGAQAPSVGIARPLRR